MADAIFAFIRCACPEVEAAVLEIASWSDVMAAFYAMDELNDIPDSDRFSMLSIPSQGKTPAWSYIGRVRYLWLHMLASAYGWTKASIEALWPEDAVALIQEIIAEEQIDREFLHSLSEIAYPYDQATKKSRYEPLKRPAWMVMGGQMEKARTRATRIHKVMLPKGKVVYPKGQEPDWLVQD